MVNTFKNYEELEHYKKNRCAWSEQDTETCYMCGANLVRMDGTLRYLYSEDYPDLHVCGHNCLDDLLIDKIGVEEDEA